MAYQQQYKRPSLAKGRAASAAKKNGKTQWVTIGVGGHGLKFRAFWTDKSKSNSKNPSDVTFTIPKEEIPEDLVDLLVPEQEEAQA